MTSIARTLAGAAVLGVIAAALFFPDLGRVPLLDPDEGRHAEVAREMAEAQGVRRLFLPTLDFRPYREKPAAYYWLVTLAYRAVGTGEAGARLVSALAALAAVLAMYAYAVPRVGIAGALASGLVAATSAGWFALARYANLDMVLTACVTVGVLAGLAWLERTPPRRAPVLPYVAAGIGTVVKGPIGAALVAGPLALAALVRRPRPALGELGLARGVLLAGGLVALLYAPVALLDRSYLAAFATTNLRRWTESSPHAAPVWYYVVWLPALFLPWTVFAPLALARAWRDPLRRPLVLWAVFVPALLSLPHGKVATYALSALVPLALVVGPELARAASTDEADGDRRLLQIAGAVVLAALVAVGVVVVVLRSYPIPLSARLVVGMLAVGWAAVLGAVLRRGRHGAVPIVVLGAMLTLYGAGVHWIAPAVAALHSERDAALLIRSEEPAPVILFAVRDPSLSFYLGSPVIHTSDLELVRDVFDNAGPAFLVTSHAHVAEVEGLLGERAHLWHATRRRRLYANRPPPAAAERNGSK